MRCFIVFIWLHGLTIRATAYKEECWSWFDFANKSNCMDPIRQPHCRCWGLHFTDISHEATKAWCSAAPWVGQRFRKNTNKRIPDQHTCSKPLCKPLQVINWLYIYMFWVVWRCSSSSKAAHLLGFQVGHLWPSNQIGRLELSYFLCEYKNIIGQHSSWVAEGQRAAIAALEKMCLNTATQARWFPKSDFKTPFFHVLGANNHRQCGYILEFSGLNTISTYQSLSS